MTKKDKGIPPFFFCHRHYHRGGRVTVREEMWRERMRRGKFPDGPLIPQDEDINSEFCFPLLPQRFWLEGDFNRRVKDGMRIKKKQRMPEKI